MEIVNEGPIKRIVISDLWQKFPTGPDKDTMERYAAFTHRDDQSVVIQLHAPGTFCAPADARMFLETLAKPLHSISEDQLLDIVVITRGMGAARHYNTEYVRTESINGKTVLVLNGVWKKSNKADMGFFIPDDASGRRVLEIHYFVPAEKYAQYLPAFMEVLNSIEWA